MIYLINKCCTDGEYYFCWIQLVMLMFHRLYYADLPIEQFNENPNTVLILVKHGGHFGFLEGTVPVEGTWMNRANQQFLESLRVFCKMA